MLPSVVPVDTPAASSPVGSFSSPRTATAIGRCFHCENRFSFAPTSRSPTWFPDHVVRIYG